MNITAGKLKEIVIRILEALGTPSREAETVANFLVEVNLVGHDSHGVIRLPQYVERIREGKLKPGAKIRVVKESSTTALIDGGWGFGQVIAKKAMEIGIAKAEKANVTIVCAHNCNDVGRLGGYTLMATEHDMIGVMTVNDAGANPSVAPWGRKIRYSLIWLPAPLRWASCSWPCREEKKFRKVGLLMLPVNFQEIPLIIFPQEEHCYP